MRHQRHARRARASAAALVGLLVLGLAGCQGAAPPGPPDGPTPSTRTPRTTAPVDELVDLRFAAFGTAAQTAPFKKVVREYNAAATATDVTLETYADRADLVKALEGSATPDTPDIFLVSRRDLEDVVAQGVNTPLLELLDERGVDYGDGYAREALLSFSLDDDLQCMPYGIDPTVVYYNTDLVDFDKMRLRELSPPPTTLRGWLFESFEAAADVATKPRRGTRGVYVPPTLRGLAPFVYSGAGNLFDDEADPTSLDLEGDGAREALTRTLGLLRNPLLTLSEGQLARKSPLQWFEDGRLGMITGSRSLVPRLREVPGLRFDVMPIPVLGEEATVGDLSGLCIAAGSDNVARAADFLVTLISNAAVAEVAKAGYLVPANLQVALSSAFLQPDQMPANAGIFNASVNDLKVSALIDPGTPLARAVGPQVRELFTAPVLDDLEARTQQIDEISRSLLDPDYVPEDPGATPSPSE